jgi:cytochrome b
MSMGNHAIGAGGIAPSATSGDETTMVPRMVRVWDPFVRIFHWSLVGLFVIAFATGEEIEWLHLTAGYAIASLVVFRILWGFMGSRHARFADFVRGPREVLDYMHEAARLRAPRTLGHNPAGGAMVLALLMLLIGISATGIMMTTDVFWGAQWVEDAHEALVYLALGLVVLHVAGVIFSSIEHGENLVKAMVTGRKRAA